jgi:hypothetical protein
MGGGYNGTDSKEDLVAILTRGIEEHCRHQKGQHERKKIEYSALPPSMANLEIYGTIPLLGG